MKSIYLIVVSFFLFNSCKPIISSLYGMNKERKFENIQDYKEFLLKRYGIKGHYLVMLNRQENYNFISHIQKEKLDYFYGIFINDSSKIKFSTFLTKNKSCSGRVLEDISNSNRIDTFQILTNNIFKRFHFINTENGTLYTFSNNNTKKIVLTVSHIFGRMGSNYKQIQEFVEKNKEYELVIISLDIDDIKNYDFSFTSSYSNTSS